MALLVHGAGLDEIYFNLCHSFFVAVLGKGYCPADITKLKNNHHLSNFEIINGPNDNSWGAKITINKQTQNDITSAIKLFDALI